MNAGALTKSVEQLAARFAESADARLERPWRWNSYDSEGVRFAFFRTYEDLRSLAGRLAQRRAREMPASEAQYILAQYHIAYRDFQAALLGLSADQMDLPPAENEWPVRRITAHMLETDIGFYVLVRFALDNIRDHAAQAGSTGAVYEARPIPMEAWGALTGLDEAGYEALAQSPLPNLLEQFDKNHKRVLQEMAFISAEALEQPSRYWEDETYSLRYRLHRFDSHLRQHTIQIDKTRDALGLQPTETQRLLRLIYAALGEVEGVLIGYDQPQPAELDDAARTIDERLAEITAA